MNTKNSTIYRRKIVATNRRVAVIVFWLTLALVVIPVELFMLNYINQVFWAGTYLTWILRLQLVLVGCAIGCQLAVLLEALWLKITSKRRG